ncbi:B1065G12.24 [Oryza sativa Japonica Group]|uniref:B1065G12.24 protein n=1 Tax=Oryza sativa subsp. japonica TaxID=39947 RepID=Q8RZ71_ORYSJ|nr:B1065G12.24 [Oryza sativa Japonica Group]
MGIDRRSPIGHNPAMVSLGLNDVAGTTNEDEGIDGLLTCMKNEGIDGLLTCRKNGDTTTEDEGIDYRWFVDV